MSINIEYTIEYRAASSGWVHGYYCMAMGNSYYVGKTESEANHFAAFVTDEILQALPVSLPSNRAKHYLHRDIKM